MKRRLIRYRTASNQTLDNVKLIEGVFEELHAKEPVGVRYLVLKLDDGGFVHFVEADDNSSPLTDLEAFRAFQNRLKDRQIEPTAVSGAVVVGDYRMLSK